MPLCKPPAHNSTRCRMRLHDTSLRTMPALLMQNHDTGSTQGHWRFPYHGLEQGYCYILTHPGTPTVFYDHLHDGNIQKAITMLIGVRRANGIHVRSDVKILRADKLLYAAMIDERVVMKIGPENFTPGKAWRQVAAGNCWCVWERD
jgi:alpha-amylase